MENKSLSTLIPGFGLSFLVMGIINAILVVEKEANEGLKKWMAGLLGHHWVTHGVFIIILFFVLGWVFSRIKFNEQWYGTKTVTIILLGAIIGSGIIALFPLF
jgi:hypothetical protein